MTLLGKLRLSDESSLEEGTPAQVSEARRVAHAEKLRSARLEAALRNSRWHEFERVDLVRRNRGWLVSATTDEIFSPVRGVVFEPYSVNLIDEQSELWFFVTREQEVVFLERRPGTWSEYIEKRTQREHRRAAER
jgi:hypothetical protein